MHDNCDSGRKQQDQERCGSQRALGERDRAGCRGSSQHGGSGQSRSYERFGAGERRRGR